MPARVNKIRHDDQTRAKIQAAQIINRLYAGFNGDISLDPTQVSIAKILLAKVLPDLSSVTLEGGDNPLQIASKIELVALEPSVK
jgi:hypothetical protein